MRTHAEILADRDLQQIADLCGVSLHTVRSWKQRDRIPDEYWRDLALAGVTTLVELANAAAERRARRS